MTAGCPAHKNCPKCGGMLHFEYGKAGDLICVTCGFVEYDRPPMRLIDNSPDYGTPGSEIVRQRMRDLPVGGAVEVPFVEWVQPITLTAAAKKQAGQAGMKVLIENFPDAFLVHRLK